MRVIKIALLGIFILLGRDVRAEVVPPDQIKFQFSESSLILERRFVLHQPYRSRMSDAEWAKVIEYKMLPDQSVYIRVPVDDVLPVTSTCRTQLGEVAIGNMSFKRRSDSRFWPQIFARTVKPITPEISQFVPPKGKVDKSFGYYRFEADDLRDYWAEKQIFTDRPATILIDIQLTRDMRVRFTPPSDGCFFRDGATLTRKIRQFVLDA